MHLQARKYNCMQDSDENCYIPSMGRPREGKALRKPGDYPSFAFRVPHDQAKALDSLLDEIQEKLNKRRELGALEISRSAVLARAVFLGLEQLKKKS